MVGFKKSRCKVGYYKKGNQCIKRERVNKSKLSSSLECKSDGTSKYCGDDKPLKPPIHYPGAKAKLYNKIHRVIPKHQIYVEPFAGSASIFYLKPLAKKSIINDKDKNIINVHKSFKKGLGFKKCDNTPNRKKFFRILNKKNKSACDISYLQKTSFGGKGKAYALDYRSPESLKRFPKRKDLGIKYQNRHINDYIDKLKSTTITSQDFKKVMKKYSKKDSFTYLDPPYSKTGKIYKENGVTPKDVCDMAKSVDGKVLISYDNEKEVKKSCRGLRIKKISVPRMSLNTNMNNKTKNVNELLIANYPI